MIIFTEEELTETAHVILKKIDKDKRFDRYSDGDLVAILGVAIMQIGIRCMEQETSDEDIAS
jgi:hypothetical protein